MNRDGSSFLAPGDLQLWETACRARADHWGRNVYLRGIVEFSNHCGQNCLYCGLRRDNAALGRYRLEPEAVFACARMVKTLGFGTVVLQSGEDAGYAVGDIGRIIRRVKEELGLAVTLSLGERSRETYALWREAGADRYLLKLEIPDPEIYARLRPGRKLDQRRNALGILAGLGYETGTGVIMGLPGETPEIFEQGLAVMAALQPDMVSLSPFIPHPATPLKAHPACGVAQTLRGMAMARIRMPRAHIPVTSALGLHGDAVRLAALEVGDVLMPSLTPGTVREAYAIYPGKNRQTLEPEERAAAFAPLLTSAGFTLPSGPGGAWRLLHEEREESA
jgi:biotin synthase